MNTRFKKGFIPWNKGTKGLSKPNNGSFKKGNKMWDNPNNERTRFKEKVKNPLEEYKNIIKDKIIRKCFNYRQWRSDIFTRDNFTCQKCCKIGGNILAHHIDRFIDIINKNRIVTLEQAKICEELWNINNGVTLCEKCHKDIHKGRVGDHKEI